MPQDLIMNSPRPITDASVTTEHMFQGQMNCDHTSLLTILRRLQKEPQKSLLYHSSVEDQPFNMQHVCAVEADELGGDLRPYSCFELLRVSICIGSLRVTTLWPHIYMSHEAITACMQSMWLSATVQYGHEPGDKTIKIMRLSKLWNWTS